MKLRALVLTGLVALVAVTVARGGMYAPPPPDVDPTWSPDGTQIAYYSYRSGVRIVNADGSGDHAVPNAPLSPRFGMSPDWRQLAAVSFAGTPNAYSLELVQIATGERRTLVPQGVGAAAPVFAPYGTRVAYAAVDGIWSVRLDGTAPIHVSERTGGELTWSPDGTRIA